MNEIGLGDLISKATSTIGIKPCGGCKQRAEQLNKYVLFKRWTVPPNVPDGWEKRHEFKSLDKNIQMFAHIDGRFIIWEIKDNRYKNSYTFTSISDAISKWDELCH